MTSATITWSIHSRQDPKLSFPFCLAIFFCWASKRPVLHGQKLFCRTLSWRQSWFGSGCWHASSPEWLLSFSNQTSSSCRKILQENLWEAEHFVKSSTPATFQQSEPFGPFDVCFIVSACVVDWRLKIEVIWTLLRPLICRPLESRTGQPRLWAFRHGNVFCWRVQCQWLGL